MSFCVYLFRLPLIRIVFSHYRHSVAVRTERSVFELRLLRGAGHVPADRIVVRRTDRIPGRHRAHIGVRLHFVQFAAGQVAVRHSCRDRFHAVATCLHAVHGTRTIETGTRRHPNLQKKKKTI